jgi:hypothetical protein
MYLAKSFFSSFFAGLIVLALPSAHAAEAVRGYGSESDKCAQVAIDRVLANFGFNPYLESQTTARLVSSGWNELTYEVDTGLGIETVVIPAMIGKDSDGNDLFICD